MVLLFKAVLVETKYCSLEVVLGCKRFMVMVLQKVVLLVVMVLVVLLILYNYTTVTEKLYTYSIHNV